MWRCRGPLGGRPPFDVDRPSREDIVEPNTFALPQIGLHHPRVRQVRKIANNAAPNHQRLLVAEGLWAHEVLLELGPPIEVFLWCPEAAVSPGVPAIAQRCAALAKQAYRISPKVLERLSERDRPDGVISLAALPQWDAQTLALAPRALVLVADAIEIPGNLGTLLRTLDACGADALLLTNRRTRLSHPKVFRGSRGMNLRVPVLEFAEVADAAEWLRERGFDVYLATVGEDAVDFREVRFGARTAFVVGNERYGISRPWLESGHPRVTVPMRGRADSLNVSVSASILLYSATAPVYTR
jgi:TrmH family RNA methyltransferase